MKVIDLLNLVYEKKAPKKILYKYCEYEFSHGINDYKNRDNLELFSYLFTSEEQALYLEVEIIEEDKEIEEIDETQAYLSSNFNESVLEDINIMQRKINELIREVNKIKKEGK